MSLIMIKVYPSEDKEKIEKAHQYVDTCVQHDVYQAKTEKPKITKKTVRKKKPVVLERINQVITPVEVPQSQRGDKER